MEQNHTAKVLFESHAISISLKVTHAGKKGKSIPLWISFQGSSFYMDIVVVLCFFLQLNSPQMTRALRSPTGSNGKIQFSFSFYDPLVSMIYTLLYWVSWASNPFIRLHTLRFKCFSVRRDRIKEARGYRFYRPFYSALTFHASHYLYLLVAPSNLLLASLICVARHVQLLFKESASFHARAAMKKGACEMSSAFIESEWVSPLFARCIERER